MRFRFPKSLLRSASRCLAGLLAVLMMAAPAAGQSSGDSTTAPTASSATKAHQASKARAGAKSGVKPGAKAKGKKTSSRAAKAARTARTARIKLAFVASAELRPWPSNWPPLRTPAAYAGVTKYAHQHSGEAAAAAYLALGHAICWIDAMPTRKPACARPARPARNWPTTPTSWERRPNHEAGNESAAAALLRGFTERYPTASLCPWRRNSRPMSCWPWETPPARSGRWPPPPALTPANRPGYQLAQAQWRSSRGHSEQAQLLYKKLLLSHPLSSRQKARAPG